MKVVRHFTREGVDPADQIEWELRSASITDETGKVIFEQKDIEVPKSWSALATNVVASKYFRGAFGPERERSVKQLVGRVVKTISAEGQKRKYFTTKKDQKAFEDELSYLLYNQRLAFNSPVWFNVGAEKNPQASACFINSVEDSMESILDLAKTEGMLFKHGSGTGSNFSNIRSSKESLTGGGTASGPVSFMKGFDAFAGAIKSGGRTRRSAKMVILNDSHPDVREFVQCKVEEEKKAWALIEAGYDPSFTGDAYGSVFFQNSNNSVRVSDEFMRSVQMGSEWATRYVTTGEEAERFPAKDLFREIAEAAHICGDPGLQFDTTINDWHTCKTSGRIEGSNPCSEYMFLDDTACNLASLNLLKFRTADGGFAVSDFKKAVEISILAQEILVSFASYPTEKIEKNSHLYRPLGLGFANLGALLMSLGLPYDSHEGQDMAAAITALMGGHAYVASAKIARDHGGPFKRYEANKDSFLRVIEKHLAAAEGLEPSLIAGEALLAWDEALALGRKHGFRNSQVTVLAPTGTIAFMMDCDTTGIEPDIALVKYKRLVGGGTLKIVNQTVPLALEQLGYKPEDIAAITAYIDENDTIEGAPDLLPQHLEVFDCAFKPAKGTRSIHWRGHVGMMAACQPFLSGAISKCIVGGSVITTDKGLRRISSLYQGEEEDSFRDLGGESFQVPSATEGTATADSFYYGGVRDVWDVTLADGRRLTGTTPHRVRVATPTGLVWKTLPELEEGDFVALHQGAEMWGPGGGALPSPSVSPLYGSQKTVKLPTHMSEDLALFLGALTADGHVTESTYTVGITNAYEEVLEEYARLSETLFGVQIRRSVDPRSRGLQGGLSSKTVTEFLASSVGFSKERVPDSVLGGSRAEVLAYLSGLYLDGYITQTGYVAISQKHRSLLEDVQVLWDNLGISTYFVSHPVNGRDYPVLHIKSHDTKRAAQLLRWLEPHKRDRALALEEKADKRPFPLFRDALEAKIREQGKTQEFRSVLDPRTRYLTRGTFFAAAQKVGLDLEPEAAAYDYSPVVTVVHGGQQEVYDISVPSTETFVAQGIVNHNTVNLPNEATVEEIEEVYMAAWEEGLKAIAVYRDGCKRSQPLNTSTAQKKEEAPLAPLGGRRRLPDERQALTHKFSVGGYEGYITVGLYEDGKPGEMFITIAKEGSTVSGMMDSFATSISLALQYGVPLEELVTKFSHSRFEPSGFTGNPELPMAASIVDYIFRWMERKFLAPQVREDSPEEVVGEVEELPRSGTSFQNQSDAPPCPSCGSITVRSGSCHKCLNCGTTTGCS